MSGTFLELPWKLIDTARVASKCYAHESHFAQCTAASKQIKMKIKAIQGPSMISLKMLVDSLRLQAIGHVRTT